MIKFNINKESESRMVLPRGVSSAPPQVLNLPLHRSMSQKNSVWEQNMMLIFSFIRIIIFGLLSIK